MRIPKSLFFFISFLFLFNQISVAQHPSDNVALMPVPKSVYFSDRTFKLNDTFKISIDGLKSDRLIKYSNRTMERLAGRTGLFMKEPFVLLNEANADLSIKINRIGKVVLHESESYTLSISKTKIMLSAETDIGALRGLETFLQLLNADSTGYYFPTVNIADEPRFPWRGLMLDVARHYMPMEMIKRNLDGMAAVKLNVMHWHLTEDQGFRVESKTFPKLHQMGSDGLYYTHEQITEIVQYADDRGIRVVPEFDIPGHATSWFVGYPEYASAPGPYQIERKWGIFDPSFNPAKEETYKFLEEFFDEILLLFPDEYVHIGGDENNGKQWDANPEIQKFKKENNIKTNKELQSFFNLKILDILTKNKKIMVGWDEIFQPEMPNNIVIHSWRGKESLVAAAKQGYRAILSRGYYIDLNFSTVHHYLNDPLPDDIDLNDDQKKLILGGEATMWSEYVTNENVDSRIWPRTASIAERLWSPSNVKDIDDMFRRLKTVSFRLEELGIQHIKNYEMMLRRLANNHDTNALKNFIGLIEPVKEYRRQELKQQTQQTPLTRAVDVSVPDAEVAREFRNMVDYFLSTKSSVKEIKDWLTLWKENHNNLLPVINVSPILWEVKSLSEDLSKISKIGLEAIDAISNDQTKPKDWFEKSSKVVEKSKEPRGQAILMITDAIEKLVKAAALSEM